MQILNMQNLGERTADILQLFFGVDVGISGSDVVHIGDKHQPAFFSFSIIEFVLAVFLFDDLADLFGMKLIKQRKAILQKQKNALVKGRSSDMFDKFCVLVVGDRRRDFFDQLLWLLVKIVLMIIDAEVIDS